jgi:hypothetical protein
MVPKDVIAKSITTFHRFVFDVSKGKVAGTASGMPVIKLTTLVASPARRARRC